MECIGNWLRKELIVPSSEGGLGLVTPEENTAVDLALLDDSKSIEGDVGV